MTEVLAKSGIIARIKLHVDDTGGSGRPVVLIHGWPLSGESWSEQVPALVEAGYRVITYDRRGFGRSEHPHKHFDYDTLAADLDAVMTALDLSAVTLVGFSMGGGEVARYISKYTQQHIHSIVFAAAVPPYLMRTDDNPDGPLTPDLAQEMESGLQGDRTAFFQQFTNQFFSVRGELKVTAEQRDEALRMCAQSDPDAALGCMRAFATTDFREDLEKISVRTLVVHGDSDATVPFEGSGARTHAMIPHSELVVIPDAPHGLNVSHAEEFNAALLDFLSR